MATKEERVVHEPVQAVDCDLGNYLADQSITAVLLEIKYLKESDLISSVNLKSFYVEPSDSSSMRIYLPRGMIFVEVNLMDVKGMKQI